MYNVNNMNVNIGEEEREGEEGKKRRKEGELRCVPYAGLAGIVPA